MLKFHCQVITNLFWDHNLGTKKITMEVLQQKHKYIYVMVQSCDSSETPSQHSNNFRAVLL